MANEYISQVQLPNNETYNIRDKELIPRLKATVGHSSKNLLKLESSTQTSTGITYTVNEKDGTVTATGTVTTGQNSYYNIDMDLPEGNYYFYGCPTGGSNSKYDIYPWDNTTAARPKQWDGTTEAVSDYDMTPKQFKVIAGHSLKLSIRIRSGQTVNSLVFKPMVWDGSILDDTFEPYQIPTDERFKDYLPLSGGTVTGAINIKSSNLDRDGEAPTSDQTGKSLYFVDKDDNGVGRIYTVQRKTNNKKDLFITVYNASGTSNSIGIRILDDGTSSYFLSYPSAFRTTLDNAAYIGANTIINNQVIIADGTDGKLKSSGYTIAANIPSDAIFTDENVLQQNSISGKYRPIALIAEEYSNLSSYSTTSTTDKIFKSANAFLRASDGVFYGGAFIACDPISSGNSNNTSKRTYINAIGLYTNNYMENSSIAAYGRQVITSYPGKCTSNNGLLLKIDSGGLTIVGGGESGTNLAGLISNDQTIENPDRLDINNSAGASSKETTAFTGDSEQLILSSDGSIYFATACNTIANRVAVCLNTSKDFYPMTDNSGSIGTSSYRWANGYFTNGYFKLLNGINAVTYTKEEDSGDTKYPAKWYCSMGKTPADGDTVTITVPTEGGNTNGVYLSIEGDTNEKYKPISVSKTTKLTTHFSAGEIITLVYRAAGSTDAIYSINGGTATTTVSGGCWSVLNYYNTNTDTKVTQTNTTGDASYRILFSNTADNTSRTEAARKSTKLQFNPSTCTLQLYNESTTATNAPATILFSMKDTTTGKTYSGGYIKVYQDHGATPNGDNMVINSGGGMFLGSGESPSSHYSAKGSTYTGEDCFITADGSMHLQANGNTIANRKGLQITNELALVPEQEDVATDNVGSIGTSSYRWSQGYFNKIFAIFAGDAYVTAKNTNTSIAVSLNSGTTSNHGIWSSGYYDGTDYVADEKWIVYRGSDGVNHLDGIATKATQDSSGNVINSTYLKLSGGTLTGSFYVSGTTEKRISLKNPTNNSLEIYMASPTNGKHGLYSTGYLNGTTYTQSRKWLVMRDSDGKVYFNECTIESSVPANAVFTDTKNTAGSTDTSSKIFLIGATSQAANPQTYSHDTVYIGTDGHLYSNSKQAVNLSDSQALTNKTYNGYTLAAACAKGVVDSIDSTANLPTSNAVKTYVDERVSTLDIAVANASQYVPDPYMDIYWITIIDHYSTQNNQFDIYVSTPDSDGGHFFGVSEDYPIPKHEVKLPRFHSYKGNAISFGFIAVNSDPVMAISSNPGILSSSHTTSMWDKQFSASEFLHFCDIKDGNFTNYIHIHLCDDGGIRNQYEYEAYIGN